MSGSSEQAIYLKPNVVIEPLVDSWYATAFAIPPATAALYLVNHQIRVMESFVANPQVHEAAVKSPTMMGGPFIHYPARRAPEVAALLDRTRRQRAELIELAGAVQKLNELLSGQATGGSLEALYPKVPGPLRGFVELVYDLHHRPYFRVFEALLYASRFYQPARQALALSLPKSDQRAFALSTPRLEAGSTRFFEVPFASPAVDELARARRTPRPPGVLADLLRTDLATLEPFLTGEPPPVQPDPLATKVRVRYLGHACILAQSARVSVMFDPLIPSEVPGGLARVGFAALPEVIDYAVLTHNHQDHVLLETLLQLRHKIRRLVVPSSGGGNLADPSLKTMFRQLGFREVIALDELETLEFEGGSITALPFLGEHGDLDVRCKAAHLLRLEGKAILCAADSNNLEPELYRLVRELVGKIDVVFLGMECQGAPMSWLYGPLLAKPLIRKHDQSRRLDGSDCDKALELINRLEPSQAYVYAMGAEPWLQFITSIAYTEQSRPIVESNRFVQACRDRGVVAERLYGRHDVVLC